MTHRRSFTREYKLEAVRAAERSGNLSQTARELGIAAHLLSRGSARPATTALAPSPATARPKTRR